MGMFGDMLENQKDINVTLHSVGGYVNEGDHWAGLERYLTIKSSQDLKETPRKKKKRIKSFMLQYHNLTGLTMCFFQAKNIIHHTCYPKAKNLAAEYAYSMDCGIYPI